jgi:transcription elongation factor Elf1
VISLFARHEVHPPSGASVEEKTVAQSLTDIEALLSQLICPICYRSRLEAVLRCDLDWRDCLPAVHCLSCGYSFGPDVVEHELAVLRELAAEIPCPTCGASSPVDFCCTLWDRQCRYTVVCRRCQERHELFI